MVAPSIFSLLLLLLLSPLLFLHSAGECPESFDCGAYNRHIRFPLSNTTFPQCGLYTVQNCTGPNPKLNLGREGLYYHLLNYSSNSPGNSIRVFDPQLNDLISNKSCDLFTFYLDWTLPNTSSISFTVSPNLTLYKCNTISPKLDQETDDHYRGYHIYRGCRGYTVYFNYSNRHQVSNHRGLPSNCGFFDMPVVSEIGNRSSSDLLSVLASTFNITFHVSKKCRECLHDGGQCARHTPEFTCHMKEKKGRSRLILILGTVIPGVVILVLCLVFLILLCGKWIHDSSYFPSKKASSYLSSRAGLEGGSAYFGASVFSYAELEEATHDFDPSKELGDGGFGTVYHGKLRDGREVAVKRLYEHNYKQVKQFMTEIEILTRLSHPNLVTLHGCTTRQSRELLLVYEYISNGTVADHLHGDRAKDGPLGWPIRMNIAIETASALAYLHASEIIHRDVKTTNILLDNDFCVKVGDFGLSRLFPTNATHVSTAPQGTPGYVDPEYHRCYQLTDKSDVYSFGVVLIELVSSLPAVDMDRDRDEINLANLAVNRIHNRALNELIDPSLGFQSDPEIERMTTSVAEVAFRCLQLETEMRPTMEGVLEALKEIEGYKDDNNGVLNETVGVLTSIKRLPFSPEGDDVVLLKNDKPPLSPASVTNSWVSGSTTSVSSG